MIKNMELLPRQETTSKAPNKLKVYVVEHELTPAKVSTFLEHENSMNVLLLINKVLHPDCVFVRKSLPPFLFSFSSSFTIYSFFDSYLRENTENIPCQGTTTRDQNVLPISDPHTRHTNPKPCT